jgi:hypothetical protein
LWSASFACLTGLASVAGCDNAADQQRKADQAQVEADQKKAAANAEVQKNANEEQQKVDDMKAKAASTFATERNDYVQRISGQLDALDKQMNDLHAKTNAAPAGQTPLDHVLDDVTKHRDMLRADMTNAQSTNAVDWPGVKAKIDKDIDEAKNSVQTADAQIKKAPPRNYK